MLQIKKQASLKRAKFNLTYLSRKKNYHTLSKNFNTFIKTKISSAIILRSPKHFNIAKHKILTINYKTPTLHIFLNKPIFLPIKERNLLYHSLKQVIHTTPVLTVRSIKLFINTTFKVISWQGV